MIIKNKSATLVIVTILILYFFLYKPEENSTVKNLKCDANIKSKVIQKYPLSKADEKTINLDILMALVFFKNNTGMVKLRGHIEKEGNTYYIERSSNFSYKEIVDDGMLQFYNISHHTSANDTYPIQSDPGTPFIGIVGASDNYFIRNISDSTILFNNFYVPSFICNVVK